MIDDLSHEEKHYILMKAWPDLKHNDPATYDGKGVWMLSGYDPEILYQVTFKFVKGVGNIYTLEINSIEKWEG